MPQRRAQVVRDRVAERFLLLHGRHQPGGALVDAAVQFFVQHADLVFGASALGDVAGNAEEADDATPLVAQRAFGRLHGDFLPLRVQQLVLRIARFPGSEDLSVRLHDDARVVAGEEDRVVIAERLCRAFAGYRGSRAVYQDVAALGVLGKDRVGGPLDDRVQQLLALAQRFLRLNPIV